MNDDVGHGTLPSTAYTRPDMEMGTLDEPREATLDVLYAQAKQVLSQSANQLRDLTERLRQIHATDRRRRQRGDAEDPGPDDDLNSSAEPAEGRQLLAPLELALRDVEQCWFFLERSGDSDRDVTRPTIDGLSTSTIGLLARNVLEAQEAELTHIAEELHNGPAQALANASFQVEVIDRTLRDDVSMTDRHHFGLRFMRERAELIDGQLEIASEPGGGSVVRLTLEPGKRNQRR